MPFLAKAGVEGLQAILKQLDGLKKSAAKKVTRAIVTAGGRAVVRAAKKLAPKRTGLLRRSLFSRVAVHPGSGVAVATIGPREGFRVQVGVVTRGALAGKPKYADPVKYAHLVELGTAHSAAKPFLVPALQSPGVRQAMEKAAVAGIDRELARGK